MIFLDIPSLNNYLNNKICYHKSVFGGTITVSCTSLPGDPLTPAHIDCLNAGSKLADKMIVIVNGDSFLQRKKGYIFQPLEDRIKIIDNLKCNPLVLPWEDDSQFVDKAIEQLNYINIFFKGGDRTIENMAKCEIDVCYRKGIKVVDGIGGYAKSHSSSWYIENLISQLKPKFKKEYQCEI